VRAVAQAGSREAVASKPKISRGRVDIFAGTFPWPGNSNARSRSNSPTARAGGCSSSGSGSGTSMKFELSAMASAASYWSPSHSTATTAASVAWCVLESACGGHQFPMQEIRAPLAGRRCSRPTCDVGSPHACGDRLTGLPRHVRSLRASTTNAGAIRAYHNTHPPTPTG
jgi:hypothetical protein